MSAAQQTNTSRATAGARAVIATVADDFVESDADIVSGDPLAWPGYAAQRRRAAARSGERESVVCGDARIGSVQAVVIAFDFAFMGGSMGEATGRKITNAFARARATRRPVVSLVASGGCRMQEGMRALVQMQRIAAACHQLREARLPHVSILRSPTTGGVWAALASGADVILAEPDATVAFAGHRVRGPVARDGEAFTSESKLVHGFVDRLVAAADVAPTLARLLELLAHGAGGDPLRADVPRPLGHLDRPTDGWAAVRRARETERPRAEAYLDDYFECRMPISGDRAVGADPGMLCGIGRRHGRAIAYAAQTSRPNTPAGFRTAARLVRLADRLDLPVLTLIDTPGAANDAAAERAGVGTAIADLFAAIASARVPITSLVIGEGGSGGALALASHDNLWITPDAYFSVIAPEAATAILKQDPADVPAVAAQQRLRPQDLVELGVVRGIAT
jgi:acetyl-CoA carboxylase carboxyl transferase subunit beta